MSSSVGWRLRLDVARFWDAGPVKYEPIEPIHPTAAGLDVVERAYQAAALRLTRAALLGLLANRPEL